MNDTDPTPEEIAHDEAETAWEMRRDEKAREHPEFNEPLDGWSPYDV